MAVVRRNRPDYSPTPKRSPANVELKSDSVPRSFPPNTLTRFIYRLASYRRNRRPTSTDGARNPPSRLRNDPTAAPSLGVAPWLAIAFTINAPPWMPPEMNQDFP